ncbi:MAG: tRNA-dihydrouridine synthase [Proteobacteria bacterium]|nr:tRNA-dihydrouridine synthase [Pseudomonadota bacterium]
MRIMLAPMEGVVDHAMRELLCELGGIDRCVTEFLRVTDRLLPPRVFRRICPELANGGKTASGVPVYLQLLGGKPTVVAENAARAAELGAPGIDLNFGCPAKGVNNSDGGSIILREPQRVHNIVAAARAALPKDKPLTVKIRLGYEDQDNFLDIVRGIDSAGATELTVHARTKRHGYRPPAYWEEIAQARAIVKLPIIANGEIWNPADALRCQKVTGCTDLMLGRGALCRPDLPRLVRAASRGETLAPLHWPEVLALVTRFYELNLMHYDEHYAANPVKQWLVYLRGYYHPAAILFEEIKRLHYPKDVWPVLNNAKKEHSSEPMTCNINTA